MNSRSSSRLPRTTSGSNTYEMDSAIAALLLVYLYPVGLILMWFKTRWPMWIKALITIPLIVLILVAGTIFTAAIHTASPGGKNALGLPKSDGFAQARDTQRRADISGLLNALVQYTVDHGTPPSIITNGCKTLGTSDLDLTSVLVPTYIVQMPMDPATGTKENSGYTLCLEGKRFHAKATAETPGLTIEITR